MKDQKQIEELLSQLTLEEKAALSSGKDFWRLQGVERLGLPSIMVTDGPHGMRKQPDGDDHMGLQGAVTATCFPTASALASTWNKELLQEVGVALGEEARAENVSVLLGPGVNMKRHPLGGRNFEYFSEDPFLAGEIATAWIQGVQSQGVGTSMKHFAVNNHEHGRMTVDVVVDERALREVYLPAFENTVKQCQPWTIMCSYNKLNGTYLAENTQMLTNILQDEWGYEGMVVTDWGANSDRVAGIKAGQGLEMPTSGTINTDKIIKAVNEGNLSMAELDKSVARVLGLILKAKAANGDDHPKQANLDAHHDIARKAAEQGAVLLKNENGQLPLSKEANVLVLGGLATDTRYQGSGSSQINPFKLEQPLEEIKKIAGENDVTYSEGYGLKGDLTFKQKKEALEAAEKADVVVLVAGLTPVFESEGFDRTHLQLPKPQRDLIEALAPHYEKLVVVLQNGSPVILPNIDKIPAILEAYLGGQAGASAMAKILFGEVNPSGKLAETFPMAQADVASDAWFPGSVRQSQYRESIWIGYRYFDTAKQDVLFPFGHGLSYTQFDYSDITIAGDSVENNGTVKVSCTVKNSGNVDGYETVQVYVGQQNPSVPRPVKELKNFAKVFLKAGESTTVELELNQRAFAHWNVAANGWVAETDSYTVSIGASIADIRLNETVALKTPHALGEKNDAIASYFAPAAKNFSDAAFSALLGHSIPKSLPVEPFHVNTVIAEIQGTVIGRKIKQGMLDQVLTMLGDLPEENELMIKAMVEDMPLRNISLMSEGKLTEKKLHRMIHLMNKDFIKAITGAPCDAK